MSEQNANKVTAALAKALEDKILAMSNERIMKERDAIMNHIRENEKQSKRREEKMSRLLVESQESVSQVKQFDERLIHFSTELKTRPS
jgi:hypothetical protein